MDLADKGHKIRWKTGKMTLWSNREQYGQGQLAEGFFLRLKDTA